MPASLTQKYRTFLASSFLSALNANTVSAYVFIGRPEQWVDSANGAVNDSNPPQVDDDTQHADFEYWRDMLGIKRVLGANCQLVVPRINWTANTVYAQYDDTDENLPSKSFYVLDTSAVPYKVYKCVWNNQGALSTTAPSVTGTTLTPVQTADGYVWQYMYTITASDYKFLTTSWMPVLSDTNVQASALANQGKLPTTVPLVVQTPGSGYNPALTTVVTITGDGTGASITSNGISIVGGTVTAAVLATGGNGYTQVTSINVYQSGVSQASIRPLIPPYPNHGYNPAKELYAKALMLTVDFDTTELGQLSTNNDFRRVGLLINPTDSTGNTCNGSFYRHTTDITLSANTAAFAPDDVITNMSKASRPTAVVVDTTLNSNSNVVVRVTNVFDAGETTPFANTDTIKCLVSAAEGTVSSVSGSQLTIFSGDVVYVNQRTPVARAATQTEEIKLVFPFN